MPDTLFGVNPLVQAATPLLTLASGLRGTREHRDINGLYDHIRREIAVYERNAMSAGCADQAVSDGRYALCTFIDEVVMNTPWGGDSVWASRPLSMVLHGNTKGGEYLFQMIDHQLGERSPDNDLLELLYVCLALGFEGKQRVSDSGQRALADVRDRVYDRIRTWRDVAPPQLSDHWKGVEDRRSRLVREVPAWVMASIAVVLACLAFFPLRTKLSWSAQPVVQKLNTASKAVFEAPPCGDPPQPPVDTPTLAKLLEGNPDLTIIEMEKEGKTTLVIRGAAFASGRAEVPSDLLPLLGRIGDSISKVGGAVQVEGHSDNQPIRSLKFQDNYELSEARAKNSALVLQQKVPVNEVEIRYVGLGSDAPRYLPEADAKNRALNRRIEIVHRVRGGGR